MPRIRQNLQFYNYNSKNIKRTNQAHKKPRTSWISRAIFFSSFAIELLEAKKNPSPQILDVRTVNHFHDHLVSVSSVSTSRHHYRIRRRVNLSYSLAFVHFIGSLLSLARSYQLRVLLAYMTIWVLPHFSSRMSVTLHSEARVCNGSDLEPTVVMLELVGPIMIKVERWTLKIIVNLTCKLGSIIHHMVICRLVAHQPVKCCVV